MDLDCRDTDRIPESFFEKVMINVLKFLPKSLGLPRSGKKFWKMKKFPGQGKVREIHFQSGKFKKKNEKSHGKVREFQNFPKRMLVNRLLEILDSIIYKQY